MLIQTMTGQETFPDGSAKCHMFVCPTRETPLLTEEKNIGILAKGNRDYRKVRSQQQQAGHINQNIWWNNTFEVPEGALLKLFGKRHARGESDVSKSILLLARADAALIRVSMRSSSPRLSAVPVISTEGRFDVVTPRQAVEMGYPLNESFFRSFLNTEQLFTVTVLEEQRRAVPQVRVETVRVEDKEVKVKTAARRRAVTLE